MELSKTQLYRETFDAALAFDALQLWESYDDRAWSPDSRRPSVVLPIGMSRRPGRLSRSMAAFLMPSLASFTASTAIF